MVFQQSKIPRGNLRTLNDLVFYVPVLILHPHQDLITVMVVVFGKKSYIVVSLHLVSQYFGTPLVIAAVHLLNTRRQHTVDGVAGFQGLVHLDQCLNTVDHQLNQLQL